MTYSLDYYCFVFIMKLKTAMVFHQRNITQLYNFEKQNFFDLLTPVRAYWSQELRFRDLIDMMKCSLVSLVV